MALVPVPAWTSTRGTLPPIVFEKFAHHREHTSGEREDSGSRRSRLPFIDAKGGNNLLRCQGKVERERIIIAADHADDADLIY